MKTHITIDGVIVSTIVASQQEAKLAYPNAVCIDASIGGSIGDSIVDGAVVPKPAPAPIVPQSVTMRQARLALYAAGLLNTVETAIASAGQAAAIEWEYAQEVQRNAGLVPQMASALGMTETQIDDLFISAAVL